MGWYNFCTNVLYGRDACKPWQNSPRCFPKGLFKNGPATPEVLLTKEVQAHQQRCPKGIFSRAVVLHNVPTLYFQPTNCNNMNVIVGANSCNNLWTSLLKNTVITMWYEVHALSAMISITLLQQWSQILVLPSIPLLNLQFSWSFCWQFHFMWCTPENASFKSRR
jgi:hypothetical protein